MIFFKKTILFALQAIMEQDGMREYLRSVFEGQEAEREERGPAPGERDMEEDELVTALAGDPIQVFR